MTSDAVGPDGKKISANAAKKAARLQKEAAEKEKRKAEAEAKKAAAAASGTATAKVEKKDVVVKQVGPSPPPQDDLCYVSGPHLMKTFNWHDRPDFP